MASARAAWQSWCYCAFRRVPLVGFENRERVYLDLDDVFVPLRVSPTSAAHVTDARGERKAAQDRAVEGDDASEATTRELTIFEALREIERARTKNPLLAGLSLIGDPGAGKTTLLRHEGAHVAVERAAASRCPSASWACRRVVALEASRSRLFTGPYGSPSIETPAPCERLRSHASWAT